MAYCLVEFPMMVTIFIVFLTIILMKYYFYPIVKKETEIDLDLPVDNEVMSHQIAVFSGVEPKGFIYIVLLGFLKLIFWCIFTYRLKSLLIYYFSLVFFCLFIDFC
jgi:hypothetical protein